MFANCIVCAYVANAVRQCVVCALCFFVNPTFVRFTFTLSASQVHMMKKRCRFSQITTCFIQFFRMGSRFCFFATNFISSKNTERKSRIDEIDASQLSRITELRFFTKPTAVLLFVEQHSTYLTIFLATNDRALMLLEFLSAALRTTCIHSDKNIQCRIRPPDNVNVLLFPKKTFRASLSCV